MKEKWVTIYDFPGYEVSEHSGRVRNIRTGKILAISVNAEGVKKVFLRKDGESKFYTRSVARLVAFAFHGEPPPGSVVIFLDFDPSNCDSDNLEWKPRWFAQERTLQHKRNEPMRKGKILHEASGIVYDSSLECARAINGIEKYIVLCAGDPMNKRYMGSSYRWVRE